MSIIAGRRLTSILISRFLFVHSDSFGQYFYFCVKALYLALSVKAAGYLVYMANHVNYCFLMSLYGNCPMQLSYFINYPILYSNRSMTIYY